MMRRMMHGSLVMLLLGLCSLPLGADEPSSAHDLLYAAFAQIKSKGWSSDELPSLLTKISSTFPGTPESVSADTLMVPYLMNKGSMNDAMALADEVVLEAPNTWQSSFASLNRVAILQSQGKSVESMQAAVEAIPAIDGAALHNVKDPDFFAFMQATGTRRTSFKDGVLGLAAQNLIQSGDFQGAAPFLSEIRDLDIKAAVTKSLQTAAAAQSSPLSSAASALQSAATAAPGVPGGSATPPAAP